MRLRRLAVAGLAALALALVGCPESHNRPRARRPVKVHKKAPVVKRSPSPQHHEHAHAHPHADSDHHHHTHPHPHMAGANGHHHPY